MKVLITATVQSHICQFHKPLAEILHQYGAEVHVAARNNLAEKNGLQLDFVEEVYDIPFARSPKSLDNLRAFFKLRKIINEGQYDVVHCNTPMGGLVTRFAAMKARRNGTRVIYTAHGFHFYKGAPRKNWLIIYPIERIFAHLTDTLITITKEDYKLAKKKFACEVAYIHGVGVNSSRFSPMTDAEKQAIREEIGISSDQKIILNVGELLPNKNQKTLIAAFEKVVKAYPCVKLLIAGNGPESDSLHALILEKKLENHVIMLGYTTEMPKYMNLADMLVACSYREGLPLNLMEAMLCENPIVASVNRGHKELVIPDRTGYLVEVEDIDAYADAILDLLQDETKRTRMGHKGARYVEQFTDKSVMLELEGIYKLNDTIGRTTI